MKRIVETRNAARVAVGLLLAQAGWTGAPQVAAAQPGAATSADAYMVVDCLLPGQVRKLGRSQVFMTPRRPLRTSGMTCEIRGGEYVSADRATFASSMAVWLPSAQGGDAKAQAYVGRIYAEGFDRAPDYAQAASWYQKAGDQGYAQALIDLGQLYERGQGVPKDPVKAVNLYRRASGLPPADFAAAPANAAEVARLNAAYDAARTDADGLRRQLADARDALAGERAALQAARGSALANLAGGPSNAVGNARTAAKTRPQPPADTAQVAALQKALAERTAELEAVRRESAAASPQLDAARAERERLQQQLATVRAQLPAAQTRLADLELEAAQARRQAAQANARLDAAMASLEGRDSELAAARARIAAEQAKAGAGDTSAAQRLKAAQADYDRLTRDLAAARADADARRADIASAQAALKAREADMAKARAAAADAEARYARAEADLKDRDARLKTAEARAAAAEGQAGQARKETAAAAQRANDLSLQVAGLQRDLDTARKGQGSASADLAAREARLAEREQRIRDLESRLATVAAAAGGGFRNTGAAAARPTRLPASSKFGFSTSYALLIGESAYRDPRLQKLATPANDATQLGAVLQSRYGFNVKVVLDKTRAEILRELDDLASKLGENDTLLIYYAGHGGMEKVRNGAERGFWLPVDAEYGGTASQISNQEITYQVARMAARKVLIIADSCYSGLLSQTVTVAQRPMTADEKTNDYLIGMAWKQSRNVLTSGRLEPVLDGGGTGNHSVFASALIDVLKSNADVITSEEIYSRLVTRVMTNATRVLLADKDHPDPQQPTYAALDNGGHVYGDFLFVPKKAVAAAAPGTPVVLAMAD